MDKIQTIEKLFSYDAVVYSYLILPVLVLILIKKLQKIDSVVFTIYGIACFVMLYSFDYVAKSDKKYFFAFYTALEYATFAYIFWKNISSARFKKIIIAFSILFFLFQIIYPFTVHSIKLDSIPIGIETIIIFIFIVYFFYDFSRKLDSLYIYNHYCFWFSVGILIYLGGSFFFYILIGELSKDQIEAFGNMTYIAEIIKNLLFGAALIVYSKYPIKKVNKRQESIPYLDMI